MKNFEDLKKELLKEVGFKREYDSLEAEYSLMSQLISKRQKKGLSQKQLADKIGTKQSAIARLEGGKINPTINFLDKVAKALGGKLQISI